DPRRSPRQATVEPRTTTRCCTNRLNPPAILGLKRAAHGGVRLTGPSHGEAELGRARRPRAVGAAVGVTELDRDRDLLLAAVLARQSSTAVRLPRRQVELQTAVVAVAGVDRPVATGLALGELVPDAALGNVRTAAVIATAVATVAAVVTTVAAVVGSVGVVALGLRALLGAVDLDLLHRLGGDLAVQLDPV